MIKIIKYLSLFIISLFIGNNIVFADINDHIIDLNKKGTISITLKEGNKTNFIEGAEIAIYNVASVTSKNNKLVYTYHESIKDCQGDLTDLSNKTLVDDINKCVTNVSISFQSKLTNNEGKVKFENLELGL